MDQGWNNKVTIGADIIRTEVQCWNVWMRGLFLLFPPECCVCRWYVVFAAWWEFSIPWQLHTAREPYFSTKYGAWRMKTCCNDIKSM
jgi:hypothetical protein